MDIATVSVKMNNLSYLKSASILLVAVLCTLASCSEDSLATFSEGDDERITAAPSYVICADTSTYAADRTLQSADISGQYVKTKELICNAETCSEAPVLNVQYVGFSPSLSFNVDGSLSSSDTPFNVYESWGLNSSESLFGASTLTLTDQDNEVNPLILNILEAGSCTIRFEIDQGWVEYKKLEEI